VQVIADWKGRLTSGVRIALLAAAVASPVVSHIALLTGRGIGVAVALGVLQALAVGIIVAGIVGAETAGAGRRRCLGLLVSVAMLGALAFGLLRSPASGLRLAAGTSHALLYGSLFVVFAATLLPGRTDVATRMAQRLNARFHDGMRSYTRGVTIAWCVFFAGQIMVSAILLRFAPVHWWLLFINGLSVPLVVLMFLAEYAIRRHRFPGGQSTDLATMVRGFRHTRAGRGPSDATAPAAAAEPPGPG
jgi:uncharacterized membrane protein